MNEYLSKSSQNLVGYLSSQAVRRILCILTLYVHITTAQQRTVIQQYGDWYTGR